MIWASFLCNNLKSLKHVFVAIPLYIDVKMSSKITQLRKLNRTSINGYLVQSDTVSHFILPPPPFLNRS